MGGLGTAFAFLTGYVASSGRGIGAESTYGRISLFLANTGKPTGKVKRFMQTAVQTTTEATSALQASGKRTGAKAKQAGGFAALLAAFFGKGGQSKGLAMTLAAAGADGTGSETPLKGKAAPAKKGQALVDLNAMPNKLSTLIKKKGEGETEALENVITPQLAQAPVLPFGMNVESFLAVAPGDGMDEMGAEKSAEATKGRGAKMPQLKGGHHGMPLQAGGSSVVGNQPQLSGEMGVDRFASMMRGVAQGKKTPQVDSGMSSPSGTPVNALTGMPSAFNENKMAEALAGTASAVGVKKGAFASGMSKVESLPETPLAGLTDSQGTKKKHPLQVGKESQGKFPQVEEPVAATPRIVRPVAMDRSGLPMQVLTVEATAALNELEPPTVVETPKSGLTRQLALQVGRQVAASLKKSDQEVTFHVRPPSLGRLQLRIEKEGDRISIHIVSEKEKAGEILAAGKQDLRALLADHGIKVDRIVVEPGGTMNLMAQDGGTQERGGRGRSSPHQGGNGLSGDADHEAAPPENKRHDGVISVMV